MQALTQASAKIGKAHEKQATDGLLALLKHDRELDAFEVTPAKKALGVSSGWLPADLEKVLTHAVLRDGLTDDVPFRRSVSDLARGLVLYGHIHQRERRTLPTAAGALEAVSSSGGALVDDPRVSIRAGFTGLRGARRLPAVAARLSGAREGRLRRVFRPECAAWKRFQAGGRDSQPYLAGWPSVSCLCTRRCRRR
ncbi:MAG: hypothetical protein IT380_10610 [Myxococcales bacterium]|nr:hypothetical protein [Myxococcales bacterium]